MAAKGESERSSLGKSMKTQNRYGSTTTQVPQKETYVKHYMKPGETLQGISLKYTISMEKIKRANNMWTNDSLSLRDFLLIPVEKSPMQETAPIMNGDSAMPPLGTPLDADEMVTDQDLLHCGRMSRSASKDVMNASAASSNNSNDTQTASDLSAKDFLSRYDSSLKQIRTSVQELERSSNFPEDQSNPLNHLPMRKNSQYMSRRQSSSLEALVDPQTEPDMLIKSRTSSTRVRTSLEQLEQQQDKIFQL